MNQPTWQPPYYTPPVYYAPNPKTLEKQQLKKTSSKVAMSMIWFLVIQTVVVVLLEVFLIFSDPSIMTEGMSATASYLLTGLVYPISLFVPFFILCKRANLRFDDLIPTEKVGLKNYGTLFLFSFAFAMVAQVLWSILNQNLSNIGINNDIFSETTHEHIWDYAMLFITTAVFPAILEELLFRGAILGLLKKYGNGFAILASSVFFGLLHGNFSQIPFAFVVGLILGYLTIYTKSIFPAIFLHFANNGLSVFLQTISDFIESETILYLIDFGIMFAGLAIGVIAFYFFMKKNPKAFVLKPSSTLMSLKEKLVCTLTCGPAIASWIIYLGQSILLASGILATQ